MQNQLRTALLSIDSLQGKSINWLWTTLPFDYLSSSKVKQSLSLLDKAQRLKVSTDYILAALLFQCFSEKQSLVEKPEGISSQVWSHYQTLQTIFHLSINFQNNQQAELFLKRIISLTHDLQLLSVILAIRLIEIENIETPSHHNSSEWPSARPVASDSEADPQEKNEEEAFRGEAFRCGQKVLSIYAPLAERLGIFWIKSELEDMALRHMEPQTYLELKQKVSKKRDERSLIVKRVSSEITQLLSDKSIQYEVQGRYKRFYSIYKKLKKVNYDFERIQDLVGFRILVQSVEDCYTVLGYVHERWTPKPGRYKDYISNPKFNGYRSLHTTLLDNNNEAIEIQIRTYEMHDIAEFGVAAHWQYKSGSSFTKEQNELYTRLRKKWKSIELTKTGLPSIDELSNKIYVLTPQNDIVELPKDATPLDFAYAIHTNIGNYVVTAKVNGKIAKLDDTLSNGDQLEVTTSTKQTPNKEWLKFVKTSKAKNKIRHAIHEQEREENKRLGNKILEKSLRKGGLNLNRLIREGRLEKMIMKKRNQTLDHVLFSIGEGSFGAEEVLSWFVESTEEVDQELPVKPPTVRKRRPRPKQDMSGYVVADGIDGMLIRFAKCCSPGKEDEITGYLTRGRGITVHRVDCEAVQRLDSDRKMSVHWSEPSALDSECA